MLSDSVTVTSRRSFLAVAVWGSLLASTSLAQTSIVNPAVVPTDRLHESWWAERHTAVLAAVRAHPDTQLLLIGDSITNNYDKAILPDENFQPTWKRFYEPRKALNLGYSGDTTAHVLWRLEHGEVSGLHPKVALVLIGTNNTDYAHHTAQQTESGLDAVVASLHQKLPETRILLLGILPSAVSASKSEKDREVNQYLAAHYGETPGVTYLDIGSIFFTDEELNAALFYDPRLPHPGKPLHPDTNGQRMMAEAIEPTLAKLMGDPPRVPLASMTDINTALIPVERLEMDSYDWYDRHHAELKLQGAINPQVVLIGDSITHFWSGEPASKPVNGSTAWQRAFGRMTVLNMGFGWDRIQNVLWRLRQGEFVGLAPRWVVLHIGTNNLTGTQNARASTPAEIVEGIAAICREIRRRSPESRIVLMAIFPRGALPGHALREPIAKTNELLAQRFAGESAVTYLNIGERFLSADGTLTAAIMPDGTHPSDAGYQIWADALIAAGVKP